MSANHYDLVRFCTSRDFRDDVAVGSTSGRDKFKMHIAEPEVFQHRYTRLSNLDVQAVRQGTRAQLHRKIHVLEILALIMDSCRLTGQSQDAR